MNPSSQPSILRPLLAPVLACLLLLTAVFLLTNCSTPVVLTGSYEKQLDDGARFSLGFGVPVTGKTIIPTRK